MVVELLISDRSEGFMTDKNNRHPGALTILNEADDTERDSVRITGESFPPNLDLGLAEGDARSAEWMSMDYKNIFRSAPISQLLLDINGNIKEANLEFQLLTGYSSKELLGQPFSDFIKDPEGQKCIDRYIIDTVHREGYHQPECEFLCRCKDGSMLPLGLSSGQLKDDDGYIIGIICIGRDLSHHKKLIEALDKAQKIIEDRNRSIEQLAGERLNELAEKTRMLKELSVTDELTKLYNRRYFFERASEEFLRSRRYQTYFSVVILDIDFFKKINDEFGHQVGDVVLYEISGIIKSSVRRVDLTARYGGEEFVILLPSIREGYAYIFCERLREKVRNYHFSALPPDRNITISMGVADYPSEGVHSVYELLSRADRALYKAKETRDATITHSNLSETEYPCH